MAVETVRTSFMRQPRRNCPMHKARNPGVLSARLQLFCSKKNIAAAPKYNDLLLVESACGAQKQSRVDISCPGEGKIGLREIGTARSNRPHGQDCRACGRNAASRARRRDSVDQWMTNGCSVALSVQPKANA